MLAYYLICTKLVYLKNLIQVLLKWKNEQLMESEPSQNCNSNWVLRYPLEVSAKHELSIINLQVVNYGIAGQFEPHVDHAMVNIQLCISLSVSKFLVNSVRSSDATISNLKVNTSLRMSAYFYHCSTCVVPRPN